jgi:hypothetical protein
MYFIILVVSLGPLNPLSLRYLPGASSPQYSVYQAKEGGSLPFVVSSFKVRVWKTLID